ncbi:hypothetical protein LINGRAHAP2_LOCUS23118 [Linum grandiflorum]
MAQASSLWIAWHLNYTLRAKSIWTCTPAASHSWTWRRLLRVRDKLINHVGWSNNGCLTSQGAEMERYSVTRVWEAVWVKQTKELRIVVWVPRQELFEAGESVLVIIVVFFGGKLQPQKLRGCFGEQ